MGLTNVQLCDKLTMSYLFQSTDSQPILLVEAVSVQRLTVPDLVVIDRSHPTQQSMSADSTLLSGHKTQGNDAGLGDNQPEAASLIHSQDLNSNDQQHMNPITFECLISYDRKKDRNLIIKWHLDDRTEPIYQWIPELNKRSIAPQYRSYIAPIIAPQQSAIPTQESGPFGGINSTSPGGSPSQTQLLEAGFKLVRPTKELGGKFRSLPPPTLPLMKAESSHKGIS